MCRPHSPSQGRYTRTPTKASGLTLLPGPAVWLVCQPSVIKFNLGTNSGDDRFCFKPFPCLIFPFYCFPKHDMSNGGNGGLSSGGGRGGSAQIGGGSLLRRIASTGVIAGTVLLSRLFLHTTQTVEYEGLDKFLELLRSRREVSGRKQGLVTGNSLSLSLLHSIPTVFLIPFFFSLYLYFFVANHLKRLLTRIEKVSNHISVYHPSPPHSPPNLKKLTALPPTVSTTPSSSPPSLSPSSCTLHRSATP